MCSCIPPMASWIFKFFKASIVSGLSIMPLGQNPHQTVTNFGCVGFSMYACEFSVPQNATILLVYIHAEIKMSFIWKVNFFFAKIGIFCKSIAGPLPSVVQAYTQSYAFGGRIRLIISQIRHELSVTIHEITFQ